VNKLSLSSISVTKSVFVGGGGVFIDERRLDLRKLRGPFAKFVDWRQCGAVMQREAVAVIPSYSGEGSIVVA
jgi:hypothetical protein